jgi:DNA-binding MarR family transcriptional regulator
MTPEIEGEMVADEAFGGIFLFVRSFERAYRQAGSDDISLTQFQALSILANEEPMTTMAMAHQLQLAGATVSRAIEALARKNWIVKERDPQDRRLIWLRFTPSGRQRWHALYRQQVSWVTQWLSRLTPEETMQLCQILSRLTEESP